MYEKIKSDPYIINIYNEISKYEDENKGWAHHNLDHVLNVVKMVEQILQSLNYDKEFIEEAKIAALLHDLGCIEGKDNHPHRSHLMAKNYLEKNNFILKNKNLVLEAIRSHSDGFETDNIMSLVLILCDKLDIKKNRVAKTGYSVDGMKEMQYINDILINIENMTIKIEFVTNPRINKTALENFYFIPKVFKIIYAFSEKLKMNNIILFNGKPWTLPSQQSDN